MKGKVTLLLAAGLLIGLCASTGVAQTEEQASELHAIWDVSLHPSKVKEYEEATKQMVNLYRKQELSYKWTTASTDDLHYYFLVPVKNLGDVDSMLSTFEEADQKIGAAAEELDRRFAGTYESARLYMWRLNHALSYEPEKPRLKPEEVKFLRYTFFYYKTGTGEEVEAVVKKYKQLYKSKGVPDGYSVWVGGLGTDMPVHCVVAPAESSADYFTQAAERNKLLGQEGEALYDELLSYVRKIDRKNGQPRPELATASSTAPTTEN